MWQRNPTNKRVKLRQARDIARATGLPRNVCMVISNRLFRGDAAELDYHPLVSKYLTYERYCMDPDCNCEDYRVITGPKGGIQIPVWGGSWQRVYEADL